MQTLVLTHQPLVRVGLLKLLEQSGHAAQAPSVTTIGQALELVQDSMCPFVIIDAGWCDWARLSMLVARIAPQQPHVQVAVLRHQQAHAREHSPDPLDSVTLWLDQNASPASMWSALNPLIKAAQTAKHAAAAYLPH